MELNKRIQEMIVCKKHTNAKIIKFVKKNASNKLTPKTLGMLFELIAEVNPSDDDLTTYFSREILINDLKAIHPDFESTNGCQWARSDNSYLGKKYKIKRKIEKNKVVSIKLDGSNHNSVKRYRSINPKIVKSIKSKRCALLDTTTNLEVDHKNGRYDELSNVDEKQSAHPGYNIR